MHGSYLSPIHEFSDAAFRMLCQRYGAEAACVPLVNATALVRDGSRISAVDAHPQERNIGVQVVGNEPEHMGLACRAIDEALPFVRWYNMNCGCPSERTVGYGGGSAMLSRPHRIIEAFSRMRKAVGKPVSVKIRMGGLEETVRLCARLGEEGADSIIIHARAPEQPYCEKADWDFIRMLRQRVDVPLVGNGDIGSASEGRRLVSEGYCDSFMVGRAAMANPMLFSDRRPQTIGERFALLEEYAAIHRELKGEPALNDIRAKAIHLMNGLRDASVFRGRISSAVSADEILSLEEEMEKSRIS